MSLENERKNPMEKDKDKTIGLIEIVVRLILALPFGIIFIYGVWIDILEPLLSIFIFFCNVLEILFC